MPYEKLTYSGTEVKSYLYFSFDAERFDPRIITSELKVDPSSIMVKDDPVPKSTSWIYRLEAENVVDLETPLGKLIDIFEPKIDEINRLKERLKLETWLQFVIDIEIDPESSTPYFGLNKRAINFLNRTNTEVDFDLYKVGAQRGD